MSTGNELRERMRKRRRAEQVIADAAARNPEGIARGLIVATQREKVSLEQELRAQFGFTVDRGENDHAWVCRFEEGSPRTPEQAARWTDLFVGVAVREEALRAMRAATAYFPEPDRGRMVCNAFLDAMREGPAALYGALAEAGPTPAVREYAEAMLMAWVRVYLKAFPGSKVEKVLKGEDWEQELVNAAALAWADRDPDAPLKRSTRFRDTLPRQADGYRQRAPGGPDFVNLVSRVLEGKAIGQPNEPEEVSLASFADRYILSQKAREAGLSPQETELFTFFVENPMATYREAGERLGRPANQVGVVKNRIKKKLGAA